MAVRAEGFADAVDLAFEEGCDGFGGDIAFGEAGAACEDDDVYILEAEGEDGGLDLGEFVGADEELVEVDIVAFVVELEELIFEGLAGAVFAVALCGGVGADYDSGLEGFGVYAFAFAAFFGEEADVLYFYIFVDGFEHVVEGEGDDGGGVHGFDFYACAVDGADFDFYFDGEAVEFVIDLGEFDGEGVAVGDDIASFFGGEKASDASGLEDVAFWDAVLVNGFDGFGFGDLYGGFGYGLA